VRRKGGTPQQTVEIHELRVHPIDERIATLVLSQVCNLFQLLCGLADPSRISGGCEADQLRLWLNGRRNALNIEPELLVKLQI
jgi:hypothetical protein